MMYLDEEHSKIYIKPQMLKIIIGIIHKTVQIINSIASWYRTDIQNMLLWSDVNSFDMLFCVPLRACTSYATV